MDVVIEVPAEMEPARLAALIQEEKDRAGVLAAAGHLIRLWRPAGPGWRNVGLWCAEDEAALQSVMETLPLAPWMIRTVRALGPHPSDPAVAR